jgi:hypothetical protein
MGRLALAAVLLLLLLPSALVPAESRVDSAPRWNQNDRWEYRVTVRGPSETTFGNLTREVSATGPVRLGNRTVDAWTLTSRQTGSVDGVNTTTVSTTYVSQSDLCVLYVNSTSESWLGELSSRANIELRYNASDGRYRFPLSAGASWEVDYNMTRTLKLNSGLSVENRTVHAGYTCDGEERVSVPAGRFMAFRIDCTPDSVNRTSYWYSDAVRGEVKREEQDGSTGILTTYDLKQYHRSPEPMFLIGTDTGLAMLLAAISAVLAAAAIIIYWARTRETRGRPPEKGGPGRSL